MALREAKAKTHGAEHVTMAIYSFNHDSFGKTTNRAGAAGDNAAYNARENETRLDHSRQDGTAAGNAAYNARETILKPNETLSQLRPIWTCFRDAARASCDLDRGIILKTERNYRIRVA